jgi:DNA-binding NtrC family response regulator
MQLTSFGPSPNVELSNGRKIAISIWTHLGVCLSRVEDDAFLRERLADLLRDEGFEVIECATAEAAELIIASTGTELQALITDHKLAGAMSGVQLAQYARSRHPHVNIIIMSGKAVKPIPVNTTFLQKPFTAEQLLDVVRD